MSYTHIYFDSELKNNNDTSNNPVIRMGHISCSYGKFIIVWGGVHKQNNNENEDTNNETTCQKPLIWVFDTEIEKWYSIEYKIDDNTPPVLSGSFPLISKDNLYLFAGSFRKDYRGFPDTFSNTLYKLNLKNFKWETIQPDSLLPGPRDKISGWIDDNNNRLYYFGGFGSNFDGYLNSFGDFNEIFNFNRKLGWNNQLVYFDVDTQRWHCEKLINPPKPRAAHTCTKINNNQVILFGGRTMEERTNDLFILYRSNDHDNFSCSKNLNERPDDKNLPTSRSWHTMVKLDDSNIFLYGGLSQENTSLGDGWMLNTKNYNWTKIRTLFETRLWHTAVYNEESSQVYVFGGSLTDIYANSPILPEHLLKISLTPEPLKRKCVNFICDNIGLYEEKLKQVNKPEIPVNLKKLLLLKSSIKYNEFKNCKKELHQSEYCVIS